MTWALAWWLSLSVAWTLGCVTMALLARRRELTVPEALEALAEAMVRELPAGVASPPPLTGAMFADGLAEQLEHELCGE